MKKHGPSKGCNVDENVDELVIVVKKAPVQMNLSINLFDKKNTTHFLDMSFHCAFFLNEDAYLRTQPET